MASLFAPLNREVTVKVKAWPNETAMMADFRAGAKPARRLPRLAARPALANQHQVIQPIDQLLDDRGVDFGDDYPRSALTAFGIDNRLDCLPYGIEPSVIYYNKRLVKLGQIAAATRRCRARAGRSTSSRRPRGGRSSTGPAAAGSVRRPDPRAASRRSCSPAAARSSTSANPPTALTLSERRQPAGADPHRPVLLQPAGISLTPAQLAEQTPLEWFESGRLALLEGSREMVPRAAQHASASTST